MKLKGLRKLSSAVLIALMLLVTPVSLPTTNPQVLANTVETATVIQLPLKFEQLPARFNWADYGIVPEAKDQSPYATCWAFALTGALESAIALQFHDKVDLSEAWLVRATGSIAPAAIMPTIPCALAKVGAPRAAGAEALIRAGEAFEDCLPYKTADMCCVGSSCTLPSCTVKYRAESYREVAANDETEEDIIKIKQALLEHGPLTINYMTSANAYGATVIETGQPYTGYRNDVLLTGWDDNLGAWIFRNNLGTSWGQDGYGYILYGKANILSFSYITATVFDPNDVVLAGDNGVKNSAWSLGENTAWMGMQWSVTTPINLKNIEFWTAAPDTQYTVYIARGKITESKKPIASVSGTATETGYYSIPVGMIPLTPGYWNVQIKLTSTHSKYVLPAISNYENFSNLEIQPNTTFIRHTEQDQWQDSKNRGIGIPIRIRLNTAEIPAINEYKIIYSNNLGESYTQTVKEGETVTIPLQRTDGWILKSVMINGQPVETKDVLTLSDIRSNFNIAVKYVRKHNISMKVGSSKMTHNSKIVQLDAPPIIVNDRTLVPLRAIAEAFNAQVNWNPDTKQVTVKIGDKTILLTIGNPKASVNGQPVYIDPQNPQVVPIISNSRTMVPVRFIAETMGATVKWNPTDKTIDIFYEEEP